MAVTFVVSGMCDFRSIINATNDAPLSQAFVNVNLNWASHVIDIVSVVLFLNCV